MGLLKKIVDSAQMSLKRNSNSSQKKAVIDFPFHIPKESDPNEVYHVSVSTFLQLITVEQRTCSIDITNKVNGHHGRMYFQNGKLCNAHYGVDDGAAAAKKLVGWNEAEISFEEEHDQAFEKCIEEDLLAIVVDSILNRDPEPEAEVESPAQEIATLLSEVQEANQNNGDVRDSTPPEEISLMELTEIADESGVDTNQNNFFQNSSITDISEKERTTMNVPKLNETIDTMKRDLGDGLIAADIFTVADAVSIAGYNSQPKADALFNMLTDIIIKTLNDSGFPGLGKYYLLDMVDNHMIIIVPMGEYRLGIMVNSSKIQLGLLLNIVIPNILDSFEEALVG